MIVPLYEGACYVERLLENISEVNRQTNAHIGEVVFVNDSPWQNIEVPQNTWGISVCLLNNSKNEGIQKSRVNGMTMAHNHILLFLDQDDQVLSEGFDEQIRLMEDADVVVGNALYQFGNSYKAIFENIEVMKYVITRNVMCGIRNMIPSPGCCLIRKESIPGEWAKSPLQINGADDWFLWILMLTSNKKFQVNSQYVYRHNSTDRGNLSADLEKMRNSSLEMCDLLKNIEYMNPRELEKLKRSIEFKYIKDTRKLKLHEVVENLDQYINHFGYKLKRAKLAKGDV